MTTGTFLSDSLTQPHDAIFYRMSELLTERFPGRALLETESNYFLVTRYASAGLCEVASKTEVVAEFEWFWDPKHEEYEYPYNGWFDVTWQGTTFDLVSIGVQEAHCRTVRHYLVADSMPTAREFFSEVCRWNSEVRGEVLVFDGGQWAKSADLFESIQSASFDNLILEGTMKGDIRQDIAGFFSAKDVYERYGIAWKRGVLFLGPPGNGKTHAVKSVINSLSVPCLYVKSFTAEYRSDQDNIRAVFGRAREAAPCILVLEDLDSLITSDNRSFFLNEMDGFASNEGIMTLATTNHPERLDPAILERPSRFDRKYNFRLPGLEERSAYLSLFSSKLQKELQISERRLRLVAEGTDGYSFAYLKELYLSAMMRWIESPGTTPIDELMLAQSEVLRSQMTSEADAPEPIQTERGPQWRNMMMARYGARRR